MATHTARARRRFARARDELRTQRDRITTAATAEERIAATEEIILTLRRIANSSVPLWTVAESAGLLDAKEDYVTQAVIAQLVAAPLAGMTPGSVRDRYARAKV